MPNGVFGADFRQKHPKSHLVVILYDQSKGGDPHLLRCTGMVLCAVE